MVWDLEASKFVTMGGYRLLDKVDLITESFIFRDDRMLPNHIEATVQAWFARA